MSVKGSEWDVFSAMTSQLKYTHQHCKTPHRVLMYRVCGVPTGLVDLNPPACTWCGPLCKDCDWWGRSEEEHQDPGRRTHVMKNKKSGSWAQAVCPFDPFDLLKRHKKTSSWLPGDSVICEIEIERERERWEKRERTQCRKKIDFLMVFWFNPSWVGTKLTSKDKASCSNVSL